MLRDLADVTDEERPRYLRLLSIVIQFNMVAWAIKVMMPNTRFPSFLALVQFIQSLTMPDFPPFTHVYCFDTFATVLYDVTKKVTYDDWLTGKLFYIIYDFYLGVNHFAHLDTHVRFLSGPPLWKIVEILLDVKRVGTEGERPQATLDHLIEPVLRHSINFDKYCVGCTPDGASSNQGKDNGVLAEMALRIPHGHYQICFAHEFAYIIHVHISNLSPV
jgi:hypothetical protein